MCNTFSLNFHFRQHIDFNDTTYKQKNVELKQDSRSFYRGDSHFRKNKL